MIEITSYEGPEGTVYLENNAPLSARDSQLVEAAKRIAESRFAMWCSLVFFVLGTVLGAVAGARLLK